MVLENGYYDVIGGGGNRSGDVKISRSQARLKISRSQARQRRVVWDSSDGEARSAVPLADFMEFLATNPQLKFHKCCIFGYFRVNLGTFFSK